AGAARWRDAASCRAFRRDRPRRRPGENAQGHARHAGASARRLISGLPTRGEQAMTDLIFYTNPMSRGRIVRWMLEEVGHPYETMLLDYDSGMKSPEYLAINPMGKVPAIKHGETVVTEGAAICAYLADAFPDAGLAPPSGNQKRGPYYRWLFFAAGPVESAVTGKALGSLAPPDKRGMAGYGSFEDTIAALESAISGSDYICGDQF